MRDILVKKCSEVDSRWDMNSEIVFDPDFSTVRKCIGRSAVSFKIIYLDELLKHRSAHFDHYAMLLERKYDEWGQERILDHFDCVKSWYDWYMKKDIVIVSEDARERMFHVAKWIGAPKAFVDLVSGIENL